jgi:NAD(P)-dependent dehydrogenase (short-subunit alcohol dehydrogenase family)
MVAIVTGGGSRGPGVGNGRPTAILFAREGARVAIVDRQAEWAAQKQRTIGDEAGEAFVLEADVTRSAAWCSCGLTAYSTSKGAVNALTQAMAIDHASHGIRVKASPMATEGTGWDIGWAAVFLASAEARWITGQLPCVDDGVTLASPARAVGEERA